MGKILVKLKDKTSTVHIFEQKVSLVGEVPHEVEETQYVKKMLAIGCIVKAKDSEKKAWDAKKHGQVKTPKEDKDEKDKQLKYEKLQETLKTFDQAIKDGDLDKAEKLLGEAVKLSNKTTVANQAKVLQGKQARKAQEAEVLNLANAAIEKELIKKEETGYTIDGKVIAETEPALINYLINSKKVREGLQTALK